MKQIRIFRKPISLMLIVAVIGIFGLTRASASTSSHTPIIATGFFDMVRNFFFGRPMSESSNQYSDRISSAFVDTAAPSVMNIDGLVDNSQGGLLPGSFHITLNYDPTTLTVTGGGWLRTVQQVDSSGNVIERGTINGSITGGSMIVNGERSLYLSGVQLTITGGTGEYVGLDTSGSGTLEGTFNSEAPIPAGTTFYRFSSLSFDGRMNLSF